MGTVPADMETWVVASLAVAFRSQLKQTIHAQKKQDFFFSGWWRGDVPWCGPDGTEVLFFGRGKIVNAVADHVPASETPTAWHAAPRAQWQRR